jgi:hypothetical protein
MGKLKTGSCPRCNNGEVFIDRDLYGWYECCLQCGYNRDLPDIASTAPAERPDATGKTVPAPKGRSLSGRKRSSGQAE